MISLIPGTIVRYHTPERNEAVGMVLPKDIFMSRFILERGAWPVGRAYTQAVQVQFGYHLPSMSEDEDISPFESMWMPAKKRALQRLILPPERFLTSIYHVGVENIESLFGRTHKYYEVVLTANCTPLEQLSRFHTNLIPIRSVSGYVLKN
jgi:hypothetical protein